MTKTQQHVKQLQRIKLHKEEYYWYLYFWHGRSGFKGFCLLSAIAGITLTLSLWRIMTW